MIPRILARRSCTASQSSYVPFTTFNRAPAGIASCRHYASGRALVQAGDRTFSSAAKKGDWVVGETGRNYPTLQQAQKAPKYFHEFDNELLLRFCGPNGESAANEERLIREIMCADEVDWHTAVKKMDEIDAADKTWTQVLLLPQRGGLVIGGLSAMISVPFVFHFQSVAWFNEAFVTADVPEEKDLETFWEVGSWAWNWAEPFMGTLSFVLLCLQFCRAQMSNLGMHRYTTHVYNFRANQVVSAFPQYNSQIVRDYCLTKYK